ncbi:MAG: DegV family protein, partial [Chloroflexi bacterium]
MIKIVTDADASLPEEEMDRYDITTIPLWVHFGEETFREGVDLTTDEFYARLTSSKAL